MGSCKRDGRQKRDGWESGRDLPVSLMDDSGGTVERRGRLVQRGVAGVDDRGAGAVKMFRRRRCSPPPSARLQIRRCCRPQLPLPQLQLLFSSSILTLDRKQMG